MITSRASAAARSTTTRTRTRAASMICGTATNRVHAARLPDRPAGRSRRRRRSTSYATRKKAVPAEPALQCAALAVGGTGRSRRIRPAARQQPAPFRRRHAADLFPHDRRQWTCRSAASCRRWTRTVCPTTRSSIFTSDNGGERFSDTWPFTGIKTELLEGGLRVPTLICWPARIPAGQVSDQVAITMDWFADPAGSGRCGAALRIIRPTASACCRC